MGPLILIIWGNRCIAKDISCDYNKNMITECIVSVEYINEITGAFSIYDKFSVKIEGLDDNNIYEANLLSWGIEDNFEYSILWQDFIDWIKRLRNLVQIEESKIKPWDLVSPDLWCWIYEKMDENWNYVCKIRDARKGTWIYDAFANVEKISS